LNEEQLDEEQIKYLKGTTTVGLNCEDGIVLATDTRATAGYEVASKKAKKLYQITDRIGVTVAGSVGDTQKLVRMLRAETNYYHRHEGKPITVQAAAKLASNMFQSSGLFPYLAVLILAGVDEDGGGLYLLRMDGSMIEETMVATGSGSPVAYGLLESKYEEGLTVEEALPIAIEALSSAAREGYRDRERDKGGQDHGRRFREAFAGRNRRDQRLILTLTRFV